MTRFAWAAGLLSALLTVAGISAAKAAQPVDDLLKEVDQIKAPASPQAPRCPLAQLGSNLGGSLRWRGNYFWHDADKTPGRETNESDLEGEVLLRLSTWASGERWRLGLSGWLEVGTSNPMWAGISRWPQDDALHTRRYAELNEIYLGLFFHNLDVTLGKKIFKNGVAPIFSPADRYCPRDYIDPGDSKKLGIWLAQAAYHRGDWNFTLALLPVFQPSKTPAADSRWMANSLDFDFPDLVPGQDPPTIIEDVPEVSWSNLSYLFKVDTTLAGWDLFGLLYYGLNPLYVQRRQVILSPNPLVPPTVLLIKENTKVGNLSLGFSTSRGQWEFHGETVFSYSPQGEDDDYFSTVVGATYKLVDLAERLSVEELALTLDYAGELVVHGQDAAGYTASSQDTRFGQNDIIGMIYLQVDQDLRFKFTGAWQIRDEGAAGQWEARYRLQPDLWLQLTAEVFGGKNTSYFGRWSNNDRVILSLEYSF